MKRLVSVIACAAWAFSAGLAQADDSDLKAIGATGTAFIAAYNAKDAKTLATLWMENADYKDDTGLDYHSRDEIQRAFAALFAEHPDWKLELQVESTRLVTPTLATQDGIAVISPAPAGPPGPNRYFAMLVLKDGKWLIASVRESRVNVASNYHHLQSLEWLIGSWVAKSPGRTSETTFAWTRNKSFIKRTFRITTEEKGESKITTGTQVVGYDPSTGEIRSWLFDSEGGFAESVWSAEENRMVGQTKSVLSDGSAAHSTDVLTRISNDEFTVQSTDRTVDEESVEDGDTIHVVRVGASGATAKASLSQTGGSH
jgi:uncharacterized protein (TIGR02246 family)